MEIIRNCSHYSSIQTALELDENAIPIKVVKTAFNEDGSRAIKREYEGITWYEKQLKSGLRSVINFENHNDRASRLELIYKEGKPGDLRFSPAKNYKKIYNAIDHYMNIFRASDAVFSHGDYSIDNILFNGDDVTWILDWENFDVKLPAEFDAVYCVMEACHFSYKRRTLDTRGVMASVDLLKHTMRRLGMPHDRVVSAPAGYMRKLFIENKSFFGAQIMKYPIMNCSDKDISNIDAMFGLGKV